MEGGTSGTISSRPRTSTVESSEDVIVQIKHEALGSRWMLTPCPTWRGSAGRSGPATMKISDLVAVSHYPQGDFNKALPWLN